MFSRSLFSLPKFAVPLTFMYVHMFFAEDLSPVHLDLEKDLIQSKMQKKLQVLADPVVVNFFEIHLIQHFF